MLSSQSFSITVATRLSAGADPLAGGAGPATRPHWAKLNGSVARLHQGSLVNGGEDTDEDKAALLLQLVLQRNVLQAPLFPGVARPAHIESVCISWGGGDCVAALPCLTLSGAWGFLTLEGGGYVEGQNGCGQQIWELSSSTG
ncbi:hypothetical protein B0H17DRAFT_1140474 [Mycena rosella]|uniref:Uncharacterized protein n=1 Tax=Mycena rosella TaxID=1033263 RepID=A0AAD7D1Y2_MYCRO|nr:hypothetical protein B0H17DRAFT_1140474 [Mycena rosella]